MQNFLQKIMIGSAFKGGKTVFAAMALVFTSNVLTAQNLFLPQNLGENINTVYAEINPVVSTDGKTLYFTKIIPAYGFGEADRQEIWSSKLEANGKWSKAERMPSNLNISNYSSVLSVSGDGNTLLVNGIYNKKGNLWMKRGMSTITKSDESWGIPQRVKISKFSKKNKGLYSNAFMSYDGNFMVMAYTKGYNRKNLNIYLSEKRGTKWKAAKKIKSLSKKGSNEAPSLSPDNKTIYFTKKKGATADIYASNRLDESWKKWSEPKRLSDTINSGKWDSYFKTNAKGSYAFYSSENNTKGQADIFMVKLYEENPFVLVKGKILNKSSNNTLAPQYNLKILVDNKVLDSIKLNRDSATYSVKLPFGKKYSIEANVPHFTSQAESIDAENLKEFTQVNKDLFVKPLPYVLVSGKVTSSTTGSVIPLEAEPKILINGVAIDSIKIDPKTGEYALQLPYGKDYTIGVAAIKHSSEAKTLALSEVNEYKEISANLSAELVKAKAATISGVVIDKKTGKPIAAGKKIKIFINGAESSDVELDEAAGSYTVTVPLNATYTINASVGDYYPVYETIDVLKNTESISVTRDLNVVPIEVGQSVRLNNIFFATGKTTLKPQSFPELDRVVQFLKENENIKVEIAGHTDNVGKAASNQQLSLGRAKSVSTYITSKGVAQSQITFKGYGMTKPVAENKTAAGKAMNRRVEFTILDK
jgi:outer membrane protein OmpA-like peptidoglycan-associated protein